MKLFHFNPNNYGEQAFVVADNKEQAIEFLKNSKPELNGVNEEDQYSKILVEYHKQKINAMIDCLDGYTIDEHPVGHVIFSEIS
jgi:hypothetical protein